MILSQKDTPWSGNTLTLCLRKKFLVQLSVKKIMLTVFWDMKGPITIDILEKGAIVSSTSYYQNPLYLLISPYVCEYIYML